METGLELGMWTRLALDLRSASFLDWKCMHRHAWLFFFFFLKESHVLKANIKLSI